MELLRGDFAGSSSEPVKYSTVRKLPAPVDRSADDAGVMEQVVSYYHETLKQSPEALKYPERRGLTNPEMIAHFRLGYANRTLGLRLPAKNVSEEPQSGRGDENAAGEAGHHPRVGTRTLQRISGVSGV